MPENQVGQFNADDVRAALEDMWQVNANRRVQNNEPVNLPWEPFAAPEQQQEQENMPLPEIEAPNKIEDPAPIGWSNQRMLYVAGADYSAIDLYDKTYIWIKDNNYWLKMNDAGWEGHPRPRRAQDNVPQPPAAERPSKIMCAEDRSLDIGNIRRVMYMGHQYLMGDYMDRTYQHFNDGAGNYWMVTDLPAKWMGEGIANRVNPIRENLNLGFRLNNRQAVNKKKKPVKKTQYMYDVKDPALTYQDPDTKRWFTRKLDKYEKNYLTSFGYEALILACPELSKNGLGVELNEEEEIILNIAELADFYANAELSTRITDYTIEKFPTEYKHSYERHFKMIKQFKRNKKG